jgi:hypothetical protein
VKHLSPKKVRPQFNEEPSVRQKCSFKVQGQTVDIWINEELYRLLLDNVKISGISQGKIFERLLESRVNFISQTKRPGIEQFDQFLSDFDDMVLPKWLNERIKKHLTFHKSSLFFFDKIKLKKTADVLRIRLRLKSLPKEQDPIHQTLGELSNRLGMEKSLILKNLYIDFLERNALIKNGRPIANEDFARRVFAIESWLPYLWPRNPLHFIEGLPNHVIGNFSILAPGKEPGELFVPIRFGKKDPMKEIFKQSLPLISYRLCRSPSTFFQMLYLGFLRTHKIVDSNGRLSKGFDRRMEKIKYVRPNTDVFYGKA